MSDLRGSRASRVGLLVANQSKPATLQDHIARDGIDEGSRREQSRSELLARMPQLPHEIELRGELEDEEELLQLYTEVEPL